MQSLSRRALPQNSMDSPGKDSRSPYTQLVSGDWRDITTAGRTLERQYREYSTNDRPVDEQRRSETTNTLSAQSTMQTRTRRETYFPETVS